MPDDSSTRQLPMTVGLYRLAEDLHLQIPLPATRSEIVAGARKTATLDGKVLEQYPKKYMPEGLIGNLRFALRYEPIALDVYLAIFQTLETRQLEDWIRSEPTSIFTRRAWYLYEFLMGRQLNIPDVIPSGYIDLLDPDKTIAVGSMAQVKISCRHETCLRWAWRTLNNVFNLRLV